MSVQFVSTVILVGHWLIIMGLSVRVIMRRPPVGVSLAWLVVVFSVPFFGAFLYLLLGEKRLGRRRMQRIETASAAVKPWQKALAAEYALASSWSNSLVESMCRHAENVVGFPPLSGNDLELLSDYRSIFDRLIIDIEAAEHTIHLGFYIWHAGGRVTEVVDALVRAARRGVQCRALADSLGSKAFLDSEFVDRMRQAGVQFSAVLPTGALRTLVARTDLRNHRKVVVIDGQLAYSGSQNLVDPRYFKQSSGVGEWVDAMVRITGPAAVCLDSVFQLDWSVETGSAFEPPPIPAGRLAGPAASILQVVPSGPDLRPEAIHQLLLTAIYGARRELVMTTPYFVPDDSMLTALLTAALRGVEVKLIVPARNDSLLVRYASVAHFDDLMSAGVRIALFAGGLLHTKSLTVDGDLCIFGSVNFDIRSLWLNFELSLLVYDHDFTRRLRSLQGTYLDHSQWLDLDTWRRRPARRQFIENACRLFGPLL